MTVQQFNSIPSIPKIADTSYEAFCDAMEKFQAVHVRDFGSCMISSGLLDGSKPVIMVSTVDGQAIIEL